MPDAIPVAQTTALRHVWLLRTIAAL